MKHKLKSLITLTLALMLSVVLCVPAFAVNDDDDFLITTTTTQTEEVEEEEVVEEETEATDAEEAEEETEEAEENNEDEANAQERKLNYIVGFGGGGIVLVLAGIVFTVGKVKGMF